MGKNSFNSSRSNQKPQNSVRTDQNKGIASENKKRDEESPKLEKKIWSFDALEELLAPTCEELDYRREKSTGLNPVERYSKLFKCTKCQRNLKLSIEKNKKVPVHPCLGVLMCEKCRAYYESGEFSLDSDGEDKYCRWCGEGGTLFSCSKCICGFCANCIKHHFSLKFFKNVQKDENWLCFFCDPKPLWFQRYICSLAVQLCEGTDTQISSSSPTLNKNEPENIVLTEAEEPVTSPTQEAEVGEGNSRGSKKRTYKYSSSSDETDCQAARSPLKKFKFTSNPLKNLINEMERKSFKNGKSGALPELQKLLKLSEYQMSFGVKWCHDTLKKLTKPNCKLTEEGLVDECQKIKWFFTVLSTYLVQFCNSVDVIEKGLKQDVGNKISGVADKHESPYTIVLQFLGFVSNQVKTFAEKGITFSEVLEASIYEDEQVIGLMKKKSLEGSKVDLNTSEEALTSKASESNESKEGSVVENLSREGSVVENLSREGSVELETDQNNENSCIESNNSSPCITFRDTNNKDPDSATEIQKLLSILENA